MDQVHLLRCLVEVGSRLGRCAEAMAYAARAARTAEEFDLEPHTGWFITGVAELAGGDLARARTVAAARGRRGGGGRRHPLPPAAPAGARPGPAPLRRGRGRARRAGADPRDRGHGGDRRPDGQPLARRAGRPAWSRWATWPRPTWCSRPPAARSTAGSAPTASVPSSTARRPRCSARAATSTARWCCSTASEKVCRDLGMRIDVGRSLLTRAHLERRRRRAAAARARSRQRRPSSPRCTPRAWLDQVARPSWPAAAAPRRPASADLLTETEAAGRGRGRPRGQQPRDRRAALRQRQDRRGDPDPDLPQARGALRTQLRAARAARSRVGLERRRSGTARAPAQGFSPLPPVDRCS